MLVYLSTLIIVVVFFHMAGKVQRNSVEWWIFLIIPFISLVLVGGLRDQSVGTDTSNYVGLFNRIKTINDVVYIGSQMGEYGFWMLMWIEHFITDEYVIFLMVIAFIYVACFQYVIISYSANLRISGFIFFCYSSMQYYNGARQALAAAIYALAIGPLFNRNFLKYIGIIMLAFIFHKSVILMLPVYFIVNRPNTFKNNIILILLGCVILYFFSNLVDVAASIDPRYSSYGEKTAGGGYFTIAFSSMNISFFLAMKKYIHIDRVKYDGFLNMYFLGVLIGIGSLIAQTDPSGIIRLRFYLTFVIVFLWPIVFKNITGRLSKFTLGYVVLIIYLLYFILSTLTFSELIPYTLNSSIHW
jgi:hypothetical protein